MEVNSATGSSTLSAQRAFDAVSLDVGGVLVVPEHGLIASALNSVGAAYNRSKFFESHYMSMAAVDRAQSDPEDFTDYLDALLEYVEVPRDQHLIAKTAASNFLGTPIWTQPVPGSRVGLQAIADAGIPIAITSNSDSTVEDHLRRLEWVQVGDGPGVSVVTVTDSGVLGVAKPDPKMFLTSADALGLAPERILHVGDAYTYDVVGALNAGMQAVLFDPYRIRTDVDCPKIAALSDIIDLAALTSSS